MKARWERLAEKIDALSLRERGLVFFSVALVAFGLLYSMLLRPVMDEQRIVSRTLAQHQSQIRVANEQLGTMVVARRDDPDAANRRRLEELRRRIAETRDSLARQQSTLIAADRMAGLLGDLVARNRNLELVALKTLPATRVGAGEVGTAAAEAAERAGEAAIYRHGVEITLQGGYFELLEYVRQLEGLPTQVLWGRLDLAAADYPKVTMKLTLYTLSLDRAWLVV
ncbi:MAG TPA: MSHA biogenesis protein MshJ [Burkholderiales bacterium]|nr:MSHA biogenesis protein MshJ [Burkholderiales bacterium]